MPAVAWISGVALILVVLWDGFESIVLPRRVTRKLRLSRAFYRVGWRFWRASSGALRGPRRRENYLSFFGPLSILMLLGIWAVGLVFGFALVLYGMGSPLHAPQGEQTGFWADLYMSATTFTTLGLGDVTPQSAAARLLSVVEAGTGFGFLALVIGYLPVLYQSFSRREKHISMLDARAGSPSTALEMMRRFSRGGDLGDIDNLFRQWESWSADLLESHISYPVLCYYRSQHNNQSWLGSLTTILDSCSIVIAGVEGVDDWQARLTFAMARHAAVDTAQILHTPPVARQDGRLNEQQFGTLYDGLTAAGLKVASREEFGRKLAGLRRLYEAYIAAIGDYLHIPEPGWLPAGHPVDNWRTSAWERSANGLPPSLFDPGDDHLG